MFIFIDTSLKLLIYHEQIVHHRPRPGGGAAITQLSIFNKFTSTLPINVTRR